MSSVEITILICCLVFLLLLRIKLDLALLKALGEEALQPLNCPQALTKLRIDLLHSVIQLSSLIFRKIVFNMAKGLIGIRLMIFKKDSKSEDLVIALGWWIPRKYRDELIGDILEDCAEMKKAGCTERRIRLHVVYQWLIAVIYLWPSIIANKIRGILKQVK